MMSTGLTFGTISALYGLTHGIVTRGAVFVSGRGGDCQRGHSDLDRQRRVLPAPPAAEYAGDAGRSAAIGRQSPIGGSFANRRWRRVTALQAKYGCAACTQRPVRFPAIACVRDTVTLLRIARTARSRRNPAAIGSSGCRRRRDRRRACRSSPSEFPAGRRPSWLGVQFSAGSQLEVVGRPTDAGHARAVLVAEPLEPHARLPAFVDRAVEILVHAVPTGDACRPRLLRARWRNRAESRTASTRRASARSPGCKACGRLSWDRPARGRRRR